MLPRIRVTLPALFTAIALTAAPTAGTAQATGTVMGTVTRSDGGTPLRDVTVGVRGTALTATTGPDGRYTLRRVPAGPQTLTFRWLGYRPAETQVTVEAGQTVVGDIGLEPAPIALTELVVEGASRAPERIVEAPAAISVVEPRILQTTSVTGQAPLALRAVPGVDLVQSGVNDFNVNARGFNSSLNRRVLVLQDGRDLAIAFLGSQEWNTLAVPLEDLGRLEMVRGPGSALYGANAFSGVIAITTPTAREIPGTKLTIGGGELETFRADATHAAVLGAGRFGYRVSAGYNRSDTFSRSRTLADSTSLQREYADATDEPVPLVREARALNGQSVDPVTGEALGDRDAIVTAYGSGRLDYYADDGSVVSLDGGVSQAENEVLVTGIGRVQVTKGIRPYLRAAWAAERFNIFGYWNSRTSLEPQYSLQSGLPLEERSDIFHVEGQTNQSILDDRGRVVVGASVRNTRVNTSGTLMDPANDDRSDDQYSAYGQIEYRLTEQLRAVAALRVDDGDLFDTQLSPKGGLVYSPSPNHSFRATINRAFQTPNYSEFFLRVPVAQANPGPRMLETSLEAYYTAVQSSLPPDALAGLTLYPALPWQFSEQTPALALGNADLDVEKVTGWEIGYKGSPSARVYLSADLYLNELENFVTDLLPGVNPAYPAFALTDGAVDVPASLAALDARLAALGLPPGHPLRAPVPQLQAGYAGLVARTRIQGANALATLPDGSRAIVLSYTNAGRVTERGVEIGVGYQFTDELRGDVTFTGFDFTVHSRAIGDQLLPNTPSKKAGFSLSYAGRQGLDLGADLRLVDGYSWAAGVFQGYVPASEIVNLDAGYRFSNQLRIYAIATNLFDQEQYQLFGGSLIGRRVLGGITGTF